MRRDRTAIYRQKLLHNCSADCRTQSCEIRSRQMVIMIQDLVEAHHKVAYPHAIASQMHTQLQQLCHHEQLAILEGSASQANVSRLHHGLALCMARLISIRLDQHAGVQRLGCEESIPGALRTSRVCSSDRA